MNRFQKIIMSRECEHAISILNGSINKLCECSTISNLERDYNICWGAIKMAEDLGVITSEQAIIHQNKVQREYNLREMGLTRCESEKGEQI